MERIKTRLCIESYIVHSYGASLLMFNPGD
jgi:hypothetical protein